MAAFWSLLPENRPPAESRAAGWLGELGVASPPGGLRERILSTVDRSPEAFLGEAARTIAGRRFWLASMAAVALVCLGLFGLRRELSPARSGPTGAASSLQVLNDPALALPHGLEVFDAVGREPADLIAVWGQ